MGGYGMNVTKILGAPGTGKTSALSKACVNYVKKDFNPEEILFVQFRRDTATSTKNLLALVTGKPVSSFKHVRTFHSECTSLLFKHGLIKQDEAKDYRMNKDDFAEFNKKYGYHVSPDKQFISDSFTVREDPLLGFYSWQKNNLKDISAPIEYTGCSGYAKNDLRTFYESYDEFKQEKGKIDFADVLNLVLREQLVPDCPIQMYDEAQDMTPAMYALSSMWSKEAEDVYYAGDPFQTIYPFYGADPVHFALQAGKLEVLPESHRLPRNIWNIACDLITGRTPYKPPIIKTQDKDGKIIRVPSAGLKDFLGNHFYPRLGKDSSVLHLARTNNQCAKTSKVLSELGILFSGVCGWTSPEMNLYNAIIKVRNGEILTPRNYASLVQYTAKSNILYGKEDTKENIIKNIIDEKIRFSPIMFEPSFWNSLKSSNPCSKLTLRGYFTKEKIEGALKLSIPQIKPNQIKVRVLTIHGAKGLEAQNVILDAFSPVPVRKAQLTAKGREEESYVWYVALTRTKKNLFVITDPNHNYPIPGVCS